MSVTAFERSTNSASESGMDPVSIWIKLNSFRAGRARECKGITARSADFRLT